MERIREEKSPKNETRELVSKCLDTDSEVQRVLKDIDEEVHRDNRLWLKFTKKLGEVGPKENPKKALNLLIRMRLRQNLVKPYYRKNPDKEWDEFVRATKDTIKGIIKHPEKGVKLRVIKGLKEMPFEIGDDFAKRQPIQYLIEMQKDEDPDVVKAADNAIMEIIEKTPYDPERIGGPSDLEYTIRDLGDTMDPLALKYLDKLAEHPERNVRRCVAEMLGRIGDMGTIKILDKILSDPKNKEREIAIFMIPEHNLKDAVDTVTPADWAKDAVRTVINDILWKTKHGNKTEQDEAHLQLEHLLHEYPNKEIRDLANKSLRWFSGREPVKRKKTFTPLTF